jgi:uncharacterized Tic20 family protein
MGYCVTCQKDVKEIGKFCPNCGKQLVDVVFEQRQAEADTTNKSVSQQAMWSHLGAILANVLGYFTGITWALTWLPGMIIRGSATATDFDRRHATESLNFQLTMLLFAVSGVVLGFLTLLIGFLVIVPALIVMQIIGLIFTIQATIAGSNLKEYRYPISIRFVK